ncbi:hypothetical protein [Novipirellula artificiosorum]|uniref:hypothetical protein n=1 Tax=Novipirellula artificiosorum TaxID=2528016 RepID=UPI0018CCFE51|nr:hypothetical protein [Novipirellula artificiosorum]
MSRFSTARLRRLLKPAGIDFLPQDSWLLIGPKWQSVIFEDGLDDGLQVHGLFSAGLVCQ